MSEATAASQRSVTDLPKAHLHLHFFHFFTGFRLDAACNHGCGGIEGADAVVVLNEEVSHTVSAVALLIRRPKLNRLRAKVITGECQ